MRLLERRFKVRVSVERAWAHLEKIEEWPSWASHIRSIKLHPPGSLRPNSEGVITLTNGVRSTFRMAELNAPTNWKWTGPFLWITVHYDHQFTGIGTDESEIGFILDGEGFGVRVFGRLFAAVYARNLDRAIPKLIKELENH